MGSAATAPPVVGEVFPASVAALRTPGRHYAAAAVEEECNPDFGACPPAGKKPAAVEEECNPDFGACPPAGAKVVPLPEDCNPDFGPCPTPDAGAAP